MKDGYQCGPLDQACHQIGVGKRAEAKGRAGRRHTGPTRQARAHRAGRGTPGRLGLVVNLVLPVVPPLAWGG